MTTTMEANHPFYPHIYLCSSNGSQPNGGGGGGPSHKSGDEEAGRSGGGGRGRYSGGSLGAENEPGRGSSNNYECYLFYYVECRDGFIVLGRT